MRAVELVEAAGIEDARTIIADFAAEGLVKSYALSLRTIEPSGLTTTVRGPTLPARVWQRIVLDDVAADVWSSGTARLSGSELVGGDPAIVATVVAP